MLFTPVKPMLLTMGKEPTNHPEHLYDIKWDGWRILIHKQGNRIEAYTRHGNQVTNQFPELQEALSHINKHTAILDCEGVVLRNGNSVFEDFAYRGRLKSTEKIRKAMITHPVTFVAFDILATDKPLLKETLIKRKQYLKDIITPSNVLLATPYVIEDGQTLHTLTKEKGMEGIVEKPLNSLYHLDTRSPNWLKHKHFKRLDTVIMGYKENPFTMIVGSTFSNGKLKPVAQVEFGFNPEDKQAFRGIANRLITKEENGVFWLEPLLCCSTQYLEKTSKNMLRITSFKGFLPEKKVEECVFT
ncbi:DNA ligase [Evansella cellulosilytica]|uniref:ATP dependent DNA ligase n=1 Tax=Evansella cellulosilytica (strain ATCC 21833 / DSM 2522 / FERM P-1141 / JCM 9156 / N-4) TaxID=649639 RepID=E6TTD1_EVAC2|nr:DNA ligase [Evansella cellulosilytica]ADU28471.1 ATP dependent DNA ligase [Evansella cellulosilytica DSM 2522]